jgi:hypothetical protein
MGHVDGIRQPIHPSCRRDAPGWPGGEVMFKPRILMRHGVWVCVGRTWTLAGRVRVMGHGYTPQAAYADWLEQWTGNKR